MRKDGDESSFIAEKAAEPDEPIPDPPSYPDKWKRRRVLNPGVRGYLGKVFPAILKGMPGTEMIEINMQPDHIHAIMIIPPKYAVSAVVGRIKGQSASMLRKKFAWLSKVYWKENVVWALGYFMSTVGLNEQQIIKYVRWQGNQDSGQAKLEF